MSDIRSQIIDSQAEKLSKLAQIVGRYKGGMEVFAEQFKYFAENAKMDEYSREQLKRMANSMLSIVAENEQLWNEAYGIAKKQDDIVELERA